MIEKELAAVAECPQDIFQPFTPVLRLTNHPEAGGHFGIRRKTTEGGQIQLDNDLVGRPLPGNQSRQSPILVGQFFLELLSVDVFGCLPGVFISISIRTAELVARLAAKLSAQPAMRARDRVDRLVAGRAVPPPSCRCKTRSREKLWPSVA